MWREYFNVLESIEKDKINTIYFYVIYYGAICLKVFYQKKYDSLSLSYIIYSIY